jgi:hypothetical protein
MKTLLVVLAILGGYCIVTNKEVRKDLTSGASQVVKKAERVVKVIVD